MEARAQSLGWPEDIVPRTKPPVDVAEERSFEAIYRNQVAFVWRLLRGMGVGEHAIQDAAQDVFMVVHRRLPEFDFRSSVRTWLFQIAYRVACDARRKSARARRHEPLPEDLLGSSDNPQEATERLRSSRLLSELLDALPDERRMCLVLADIEGLSAPEIAALAGVPLNTVYTWLRRARLELSRELWLRGWGRP